MSLKKGKQRADQLKDAEKAAGSIFGKESVEKVKFKAADSVSKTVYRKPIEDLGEKAIKVMGKISGESKEEIDEAVSEFKDYAKK